MMTKNTMLIFLGVSIAMLSCKKDQTGLEPVVLHKPDASALSDFFHDNLDEATQHFHVDVTQQVYIEGEQGLKATFFPNTLMDAFGNDITGIIDVTLVEIFNKKDMILKNKPTLAFHQGEYKPLISGGEFYLEATQNGQPLFLKPYQELLVKIPRTDYSIYGMNRFISDNENDTLIWSLTTDSTSWFGVGGNQNSSTWQNNLNTFGWINCDTFMNDPRPQTIVEAELPVGYNNTTCKVFISFDGLNSLTSFKSYEYSILSTAPYYSLPVGLEVHFVAITIINDVIYCEVISDTIEENHRVQITNLEMVTESEFEALLDALP